MSVGAAEFAGGSERVLKTVDEATRETGAGSEPLFDSVDGLLRELAREPEPSSPPAAPEPSLPAGTRVGRFELLREIGRGGFGVVYEARDASLGRLVAFKLVRGGRRVDERRERLLREAEAAARLSHPNVVTLFDLGTSEHGPYLILELLEGETLGALARRGPLSLAEVARIGVEMATGLAHAHKSGVVHGDITPGNVYVCSNGRVKLLDLGLAHVFGSSGSGGGTRGYMAPELNSGAPLSERTDVFALGVVLFRMVVGRVPYRTDDEVRRPRLELREAPALASAIEHMLAPDAADRPRDGIEALRELTTARDELAERSARGRQKLTERLRYLAVGGLLLGAMAGGLLLGRGRGGSGAPPPRGSRAIAVLPFVDRSPERDQEYLAEGVADQLRATLARVDGLRVIGRPSSTIAARSPTLSAAASTLGVDNLLGGSTRRLGDRVEVNAELRDSTGDVVWSHTYVRPAVDIFAIQGELASNALASLGLGGEPGKPLVLDAATASPEAYTELLKGRQHQRSWSPESHRLAREAYERALRLDPTYAPAWTGLAFILFSMFDMGEGTSQADLRDLRQRAQQAADKAVSLKPDLPEALSARGILRGTLAHDWSGAMADLTRAMALAPKDVDILRRYSALVAIMGRIDDAIAAAEKATAGDPLNSRSWATLATYYGAKGRLTDAERAARRALATSGEGTCVPQLGDTLLLQSKPADALAAFSRCPEPDKSAGTAMAEHSLGHADGSRAALTTLATKYPQMGILIARVHAWRGEKDDALTWVDRASTSSAPDLAILRWDPFLAPVRNEARVTALLRKLRLPAD